MIVSTTTAANIGHLSYMKQAKKSQVTDSFFLDMDDILWKILCGMFLFELAVVDFI